MPFLGAEIFRGRDAEGEVVVYQHGDRRILAFGNQVEQSGLCLRVPTRLEYAYTQAMMLATLWPPAPRRALVLGLGGGSLARALRAHFPRCRVTAVEARALVVQVAQDYFYLPRERGLDLRVADARTVVAEPGAAHGLILADLYQEQGMSGLQEDAGFLSACRERLTPDGILVLNLWGSEADTVARVQTLLDGIFQGQVLDLRVRGGNLLLFARATPFPTLSQADFLAAAMALGRRMGIPLLKLARQLWRQNPGRLGTGRGSGRL